MISPNGLPEQAVDRVASVLAVGLSAEDCISIRLGVEAQDLQVFNARDCRESSAILAESTPRIIICERDLPDGSWRDILVQCETMACPPAVIVVSRLADEYLWAEVLNLGGYDVIATPLDRREVARAILPASCRQRRPQACSAASMNR
jgi:DNA-binding response OmpR family regulator